MKKFLYLIMMLVLVLPFAVDAKKTTKSIKPVNVYVFYGDGCGYCAKLHEYTAELEKDSTMNKKFKIVDYEVWKNQTNSDLMIKVGTYFNQKITGVPFYVVGEETFSGWDDNSGATLKAAINEAYSNKKYKDVVAKIIDGSIEVSESDINKVQESSQSNTDNGNQDTSTDKVAYVILGVTIVIVLAIIFGRSKSDDEEKTKKTTKK